MGNKKKKRGREKKPPEANEPKAPSPETETEKDPWNVAEEVRDLFGHHDDDKHLG